MKRVVLVLFLTLLGALAAPAQSYTPNCNLFLAPQGYQPWTTPMNDNLVKMDNCLGILQNFFQGNWSSSTIYAEYQQVNYGGSLYISLQNSNYNQNPVTATAYWQLYYQAGSGALFPSSPGIVFNTTMTASRNATAADITTVLGYTPLKPSNNLSDVASAATALANLGGSPIWTLTTTGSSGAATYSGNVLNIPNYSTGTTPPLTTKGDLYTYTTTNARLGVGTNGTILTADSTQATGLSWVANSGVSYNPSNTLYLWAGPDSIVGDDAGGFVKGSPIPVSTWSISGGVCSFVNTGTNGLAVGEWFTPDQVTGFPAVPSPYAAWTTGYDLFQVSATGLSSTTWQAACPLLSNTSGAGGNAENANYFLPFYTASLPFFNGHGSTKVALPVGSTVVSMAANYSTVLHPLIVANSPNPTFVFITGGRNDISACTSVATIEADLQTVWASIHTDGGQVVQATLTPNPFNTTNAGCHLAFNNLANLNRWIKAQGKNNFNSAPNCSTTCGKYWDRIVDATIVMNDLNDTNVNVSGGGLNASAIARYANLVNEEMSSQGTAERGFPDWITAGVNGGSLAPGFGIAYVPSADTLFSFSWWDSLQGTNFMVIDTRGGPPGSGVKFPYLGATACLATNSNAVLTGNTCMTSLTTTGTSGAATFSGGILNIPQYAGGLSGMTAGQVPIAATATTATSSEALAGSGAGITTGPTTAVSGDVTTFTSTAGQIQDSGTLLSSLAPLASPTFTGTPAAPTPGSLINTTQIPTTAYLTTYYAPLASPTFTGTPAAPTAVGGTNTTQLATTAFVQAAIAAAGTGAGIVTYSGPSLTFTSTQYFPIGGGAAASTTETNVDIDSPAAVTIQNMTVQMSVAPGIGNSVVFTWRKNAAGTALTCTISGASATSCSDTTHNFSTAALDLLDIQAVTTGTVAGTPTVVMAAQVGIAATATTAFSAISGGTNTAAAMVVGTGSSLTFGGSGSINANQFNGATVSASIAVVATNSSSQFVAATTTGTGTTVALATSPSFTTPSLGAATASSLLASGIVDGEAPVTLTTGASCTLGTTSGCSATAYDSGYTFNQEGTAATAITYTLPTAAAGKQYCVANDNNGSVATTGTLEILTSASGQFITFTDGTQSATGGYVISGGAAGDSACVVGKDATHWRLYVSQGTWTKH